MNDSKIIALINAMSGTGTGTGGSTTLPVASSTTLGGVKVGTGISVTSDGTISATNTGSGTVTSVSSANTDIAVTNGSSTPTLTLNSGTSANQILKVGSDGKLPAIDGSKLTGLTKTQVGLSNVDNLQQIPLTQKGAVNGVASLDSSGKIPLSQVPVVSANVVAVANQTARLALPTSTNLTIAIQADTNRVWGLNANLSPATASNWVDMGSSSTSVASINGATGAVTVNSTTVGLNNVTNDKQVKAVASSVDQDILVFSGTTGDTVSDSGKKLPAGLVVGTTDTQTLVNKTLTNPVISTISNTGTITLPTSTDTLVGRATIDTLTNKTLLDTNIISNSTDTTKKIQFDASGITTGTTRTLIVPNKSGTIALTSDITGGLSTVDYVSLAKSTSTTLTGSTDIIFDKVIGNMTYNSSNGLVTLIANKTYLIQAGMRQTTSSAASDFIVCNSSNVAINPNASGSANSNTSQGDCIISFFYTPSVDTPVKLRNTGGTGSAGGNQQWMIVAQIGSSAITSISSSLIDAPWQSYTPTITATTTNPSLGTGADLKAIYRTIGKTLYVNFNLFSANAGTNGSGAYQISIPSGYTIDTSKIRVAINGYDGSTVGKGMLSLGSSYTCDTKIVSVSSSTLGVWAQSPWNTNTPANYWSGSFHGMNTNISVSFMAEIPIL